MLNSEPVESEIPIGREDLALETQIVFNLYDKMQAQWEGMSGQYLGKDMSLLPALCDEYDIDSCTRRYAWEIIPYIDSFVAKDIARKIKSKSKEKLGETSGRRPSHP
jgi:hypothetical protein